MVRPRHYRHERWNLWQGPSNIESERRNPRRYIKVEAMLSQITVSKQYLTSEAATTARPTAAARVCKGLIASVIGVATGTLFLISPNTAHAASCANELQNVSSQWSAVSYPSAPKPSARVVGKGGYVNTGAQVEYMKTEAPPRQH